MFAYDAHRARVCRFRSGRHHLNIHILFGEADRHGLHAVSRHVKPAGKAESSPGANERLDVPNV
jgi:hypothetical protein